MRFFLDTEFHEDGETIDPISIALVAENGDSLYRIYRDADWSRASAHPWLPDNVLRYLPGAWGREFPGEWRPDWTDPRVQPKAVIAEDIRAFIGEYGPRRDDHELWAWYGAYDHVLLAQTFGRMLNLPGCVPMHTNDLKTIVQARIPETLRDGLTEHDALADAQWNARVYAWARGQEKDALWQWRQQTARRESEIAAYWLELPESLREAIRQDTGARSGFTRALDAAAGLPTS